MSSQPPPPPRTTSAGPQSAGAGPSHNAPPQQQSQQPSQQNLNQIVLEYLAKKGYSRTESMLRKESAFQDADGRPITKRAEDAGGDMYFRAYDLALKFIESTLDIYKHELLRLRWPLFVYAFINLAADYYPAEAEKFYSAYRGRFEKEYQDDLRALSAIRLPEHIEANDTAQLFRSNRYRVTLTNSAYSLLIQYLEAKDVEGGSVINNLLSQHFNIVTIDRAAAGEDRSLARIISRRIDEQDVPTEDEGIPGHNPGSANTDRNAPPVLTKLALGPMSLEPDLMDDVKAELEEEDAAHPPAAGRLTLMEEFEMHIKKEPTDDAPSREAIPFPPSLARNVAMEVQRVKENRDRFKIEGHTGGVGPGVSVTMFTIHNTFDSLNCMEFSGDQKLVAVGTSESYIKVWSLENKPLTSPLDPPGRQPSATRRLVGHSGPVYALSFSPSINLPKSTMTNGTATTNGHTNDDSDMNGSPRYLISSSADTTIRLWELTTYTNLVVYRSHSAPVWDLRFAPQGHYFISGSSDRTARLWSTAHITPHRLFVGHDSDVDVVAWHPNGAYVFTASGSADKSVRMWDIQRGNAVRMFTGHAGNVTALSASPNGRFIASADDRGEVIVWDLATGRLTKRMRGHGRGGVWSLDWSVESTVLASGGADGTVRIWDVKTTAPNSAIDGKIVGEGGAGTKIDGANASTTTGVAVNSASAAGGQKKTKGKDVIVSPDQISAFPTKKSPVYKVRFTPMNLVIAGGAYLP